MPGVALVTDASVPNDGRVGRTSTTWLERVRSLDPTAWQTFVTLYGPLVYHWCRQSGLQEADAADVGQEVFRAVFGAVKQFDHRDGSFRGWLRIITLNKVRDFFRQRDKEPGGAAGGGQNLANVPANAPGSSISSDDDPAEGRILLRRAVELILTDCQEATRQAFLRVVVDREEPARVARELGLSVNAVYLAKSRIMRRLREEFSERIRPDPPTLTAETET
jgi:RNA polymerase sigma-70 factor (ECF subfamily)